MGKYQRDKTGREIMPGDTVKVFHFIGSRRKRHYMYKFVERVDHGRLVLAHLCLPYSFYTMAMDGRTHEGYEIVQGHAGVEHGQTFMDRPKLTTPPTT